MSDTTAHRDLLRLITCGSVDDGKSTLIGRLLADAGAVPEDQLRGAVPSSDNNNLPDYAMLLDGLQAEREQGITIDVGYRFFTTPRRRFILADTPGHEQYTRNMATGASAADVAIVLVDASKGLLSQTWRHSAIVSTMGIRRVVLAVNKMDLIDYRQRDFADIVAAYASMAGQLGLSDVTSIPVSALQGDNVIRQSDATPWYQGPTLLRYLETVEIPDASSQPFRFSVQWVNRGASGFRSYAGTILGGHLRVGDEVAVQPSGVRSRVSRIITFDGDLEEARAGQAVSLTLTDAVDVSRGDLLAGCEQPPHLADQFAADLVWLDEAPMLPGRPYVMRLGTATFTATVTELKHRLDMNTGAGRAAKQLDVNQIGFANLGLDRPAAFDAYADNRNTGNFILIDRVTNGTVGAGMIRFPLRRAANLTWQNFSTDRSARSAIKGHRPAVLWFTGFSGSGKSTVADAIDRRLLALGSHTYILDGDNIRHGLNRDLGFTDTDRVENIRRVIEVARLLADAGLIVLVSFISPFRAERQLARERLGADEFLEIFVDASLAECERRDPKGLYRKAREGKIANFTGLDSAYEPPETPDIHLRTAEMSVEQEVELVLQSLRQRGILD
ncbi:adenylyl-sulfate kinase [Reyranella sp.]|uniref:adenylyl-sulfate kinase n=1 Tax=Reyranella sp. TaxID=1929291 RepID=UPI003F6F160E